MPDFDNRKDAWEYQAGEQLNNYMNMDEDQLLALAANGNWDQFYVLRSALKKKWTKKSVPVLIDILRQLNQKELYLERYHICETIFEIIKFKDENILSDISGFVDRLDLSKKENALQKLEKMI